MANWTQVREKLLGRILYQQLKQRNKNFIYLDGDDLRRIWKDEEFYWE